MIVKPISVIGLLIFGAAATAFSFGLFWTPSEFVQGLPADQGIPSEPVARNHDVHLHDLPTDAQIFGRSVDLSRLKNPLRRADGDPGIIRRHVEAGRTLYNRNCVFCHGAALDGNGLYAGAFVLRPADLRAKNSVPRLAENYLFWRIYSGAESDFPDAETAARSAMPAWKNVLSEEKIWQLVLFLKDAAATDKDARGPGGAGIVAADLFARHCASCHGPEGGGNGPAAERFEPRPRDFKFGLYKYRTTDVTAVYPLDEDLARTIRDGLPGTGMPAWKGVLNEVEIRALVVLLKKMGDWRGAKPKTFPTTARRFRPPSTSQRLAAERRFKDICAQCHGEAGRGNVTTGKILKDEWGKRIWPRNLTRPDTFRWAHDVFGIFRLISIGIQGTPMPEHTTEMSDPERWALAHYVKSLGADTPRQREGRAVIRANRIDTPLPKSASDPAWRGAEPTLMRLAPNIMAEPRLFYAYNDAVVVRALFNDQEIAFLVDVDDRTYSVPGHMLERRHALSGVEATRDAVAVQFPSAFGPGSHWPRLAHGGNGGAVRMWSWRAPSADPKDGARVGEFIGNGAGAPVSVPSPTSLDATAKWSEGRWQVIFRRSLNGAGESDVRFTPGRYFPVSFANWDGWAGHVGSRHLTTDWHWLLLGSEPETVGTKRSAAEGTGHHH